MNSKLTEIVQPWYRHPWPWILMLGPFVVVVAGMFGFQKREFFEAEQGAAEVPKVQF